MFKIDIHHLPYADEDVNRLVHIATGEISEAEALEMFESNTKEIGGLYGGVVFLSEETRVTWGYTHKRPRLDHLTPVGPHNRCAIGNLYVFTFTDIGQIPAAGQPKYAFNIMRTRAAAIMKRHQLDRMTDHVWQMMYGESA